MIYPLRSLRYNPGQLPLESISVYPSEEDRKWSNGTRYSAKCKQIRKNITIAYDDKNLFLIKIVQMDSYEARHLMTPYYGIIIFRQDIERKFYDPDHEYHLDRTIKGYYVFTHTYYKSRCIPGKDYEDEVTDIIVFDENGNVDRDWDNKDIGYGQIPIEIAKGLVVYNNVFYDLDTLKEKFRISSKYSALGCFVDGLLHLQVPEDEKNIYALVKNAQIIEQFTEEELNSKIDYLSIMEKQYLDSKYSVDYLPQINIDQCEDLRKRFTDIISYNEIRGKYRSQTDYILSIDDTASFDNECENSIPQQVNEIINQQRLYYFVEKKSNLICKKEENNRLYRLTSKISCYISRNITFLGQFIVVNNQKIFISAIYDKYGQRLSKYNFVKILNPNLQYSDRSNIHKEDNAYGIFEARIFETKQKVVFGYYDGKYFETIIPKDCSLYVTANGACYIMNDKKDSYYDIFMNPIIINFVQCSVRSEIDKYLYIVEPNFYPDERDSTSGVGYYVDKTEYLGIYSRPKLGFYNGHFCLPYPNSFKFSIEEMESRNNNRPNFISYVSKVRTFTLGKEIVSIYRFHCAPWAYCDLSGNIYYDFDANNIHL